MAQSPPDTTPSTSWIPAALTEPRTDAPSTGSASGWVPEALERTPEHAATAPAPEPAPVRPLDEWTAADTAAVTAEIPLGTGPRLPLWHRVRGPAVAAAGVGVAGVVIAAASLGGSSGEPTRATPGIVPAASAAGASLTRQPLAAADVRSIVREERPAPRRRQRQRRRPTPRRATPVRAAAPVRIVRPAAPVVQPRPAAPRPAPSRPAPRQETLPDPAPAAPARSTTPKPSAPSQDPGRQPIG